MSRTIKEAKTLKKQLESDIRFQLKHFMEKTNLTIKSIKLITAIDGSDEGKEYIVNVDIKAQI